MRIVLGFSQSQLQALPALLLEGRHLGNELKKPLGLLLIAMDGVKWILANVDDFCPTPKMRISHSLVHTLVVQEAS